LIRGVLFFIEDILPYIAIAVFLFGTVFRLWMWLKVPVPLRINMAPAKTTWRAVTGKIAAEVLVFVSLLRNDKALWAAAWIMHVCGLVVILGSHIFGLVDSSIELWTPLRLQSGKTIIFIAAVFSFPLIAALLFLLLKRVFSINVKRISIFSDYFALILILVHVSNGIYMSFFTELDMAEMTKWGMGLATLKPYVVEGSWIFALHCFTACALFIYFPFSKLFHPLGQIVSRWTLTQKEKPLVPGGAVVE